jgi:hypothetical protein
VELEKITTVFFVARVFRYIADLLVIARCKFYLFINGSKMTWLNFYIENDG